MRTNGETLDGWIIHSFAVRPSIQPSFYLKWMKIKTKLFEAHFMLLSVIFPTNYDKNKQK